MCRRHHLKGRRQLRLRGGGDRLPSENARGLEGLWREDQQAARYCELQAPSLATGALSKLITLTPSPFPHPVSRRARGAGSKVGA